MLYICALFHDGSRNRLIPRDCVREGEKYIQYRRGLNRGIAESPGPAEGSDVEKKDKCSIEIDIVARIHRS